MLIPSSKVVFEGASTKEYYRRQKGLKTDRFNGCIHIAFYDFEGVVFFSEGEAVTALQESSRWLELGEKLVEPVENKAIAAADARMSALELPGSVLNIFLHRRLSSTVETELNEYITIKSLAKNLEKERATCLLKIEHRSFKAYIYILSGLIVGTAYGSDKETLYGEDAIRAMTSAASTGRGSAIIYFMEEVRPLIEAPASMAPSEASVSAPATASAEVVTAQPPAPAVQQPITPVQPVQPAQPAPPLPKPSKPEEAKPEPVKKPVAVEEPVKKEPVTGTSMDLKVVSSNDKSVGIVHRSRLNTFENLEDHSIAWVGPGTLGALKLRDASKAKISMHGKEYSVTVRGVNISSGESRFIVLPRKLRKKLSIELNSIVALKP